MHNGQQGTILLGKDEFGIVLADNPDRLVRDLNLQDIGFHRTQKVFIESFTHTLTSRLDASKVNHVAIGANGLLTEQFDAHGVVVSMQALAVTFKSHKVGGIEFEGVFGYVYFKRSCEGAGHGGWVVMMCVLWGGSVGPFL